MYAKLFGNIFPAVIGVHIRRIIVSCTISLSPFCCAAQNEQSILLTLRSTPIRILYQSDISESYNKSIVLKFVNTRFSIDFSALFYLFTAMRSSGGFATQPSRR